jgi:hypothetical protein
MASSSKGKSITGHHRHAPAIKTAILPAVGALLPYQDPAGNSGIAAYRSGGDFIIIQFKTGGIYLYTYASAGREHIENLKKLAASHDGLNTYISQHVKEITPPS